LKSPSILKLYFDFLGGGGGAAVRSSLAGETQSSDCWVIWEIPWLVETDVWS